jgi:hypothetical protein
MKNDTMCPDCPIFGDDCACETVHNAPEVVPQPNEPKDIWNKIVECHNEHFMSKETDGEDSVQKIWESVFEHRLGYPRHEDRSTSEGKAMIPQEGIQVGTKSYSIDIAIVDGDRGLLAVELKLHNCLLESAMESQLFSYMRLFNVGMGILVCYNLYVYDKRGQRKVEIEFTENNPIGVEFVKTFNKENFSPREASNFVHKYCLATKSVENLQFLKEYFNNDDVKNLSVEEAFQNSNVAAILKPKSLRNLKENTIINYMFARKMGVERCANVNFNDADSVKSALETKGQKFRVEIKKNHVKFIVPHDDSKELALIDPAFRHFLLSADAKPLNINRIVDKINTANVLGFIIDGEKIRNWLISKQYLRMENGKSVATEKGKDKGISQKLLKGYPTNVYSSDMQMYIIDNLSNVFPQ